MNTPSFLKNEINSYFEASIISSDKNITAATNQLHRALLPLQLIVSGSHRLM